MRKGFLVISIIFIFLLLFVFLINNEKIKDKIPVCFSSEICISAEIAKTDEEKSLGLMHRESLEKTKGMLFPYESEEIRAFWMKNMNFPIDIIWLDKDKKIVYIHENVQQCAAEPCQLYAPDKNAMYVLEVNANFSRDNNLSIGKEVTFIL